MTIKEILNKIKEYKLQKTVQNTYNKNYINVKSEYLLKSIVKYEDTLQSLCNCTKDKDIDLSKPKDKIESVNNNSIEKQFKLLVNLLGKKHILLPSEIAQIFK